MTQQSEAPSGPPVSPIIDRRVLTLERLGGELALTISEFDSGHRILTLTASNGGVQTSIHFDAAQWHEFQTFVQNWQAS